MDIGAVRFVNRGHHLPAGVEGGFVHPGLCRHQHIFGQAHAGGKIHQGRLGGLTFGLPLFIENSIRAQGHGSGQQLRFAGMLHHGHLVLRQGAGLVGADDLGAAQGLHSGQPADDRIALAHIGHANAQYHSNHSGQALRDGGNRQGNRHHEGFQHHGQVEVPGHSQVKEENEHTDAQDQLGKGLAQVIQLFLQGSLFLHRSRQGAGDLAHLGVHAGAGDQGFAPAVDHGGTHIAHIFPVAQRHILPVRAEAQGLDDLIDGDGLAGEGGFLDLQAGTFNETAVCRDTVAGFQNHDVAGNQLVGVHDDLSAVPQDFTGGRRHGLQGFDGGLGLALLEHTQHRVQRHHHQDDAHLRQAFIRDDIGDRGNRRRHHQDDQHGIFQLRQETLEQGGFFGVLELIGAVFFQPLPGLGGGQPFGGGPQFPQNVFGGMDVFLLHQIILLFNINSILR